VEQGSVETVPGRDEQIDLRHQLRLVGRMLRGVRLQRGLSMQQVSAATGVSTAMISLVERGLASPSLTTLSSLGGIYGLSLGDLFNGATTPVKVTTNAADSDAEVVRRVLIDRLSEGLRVSYDVWAPGTRESISRDEAGCIETFSVITGELVMTANGSSQVVRFGESVEVAMTHPVQLRNAGQAAVECIRVTRC